MNIQKGQKADVTKGRGLSELQVSLGWSTQVKEMEVDGAAFLLSANGSCASDEDFIFYGQPVSRGNAVRTNPSSNDRNDGFQISIPNLPGDIEKIAFTLTIHEGEKRGYHFSSVKDTFLLITDSHSGEVILRFEFGQDLQQETAIVLGELYRYKGEWKFNAIGSGFHGGLAALCNNFGIEVDDEDEAETAPAPVKAESYQTMKGTVPSLPVQEIPKAHQPNPIPAAPVMLQKVELKKKESILIKKTDKVTAMLEWENKHKDLDLYCFYVTKNNNTGKIYYKNLGKPNQSPYITLDGDSRQAGRETVIVHRPDELKYVLFAAYSAISNGFGSFKGMKAKAVVDNHNGQTVIAPLLQRNIFSYWVAIAHIDFTDSHGMKISHVETYSRGGSEKSPLLYEDGSFKMDVGPEEFKR